MRFLPLLFLGLLLAACEKAQSPGEPPHRLLLTRVSYAALPGWREDASAATLPALARSCARLERQPPERPVGPGGGGLGGTVADWTPVCAALAQVPRDDHAAARAAVERLFVPYKATDNDKAQGLFTGYYEAELNGALFPGGGYDTPLYGVPPDLVTVKLGLFRADLDGQRIVGRVEGGQLVPYRGRREIDEGALADQGLELLWSDDPIDVFFLQIQGSGQVQLPDGEVRRVGFAGSNGLTFTGIGRILLDEGHITRDQMSMQSIRDWLRANPQKAEAIMHRNARFIFFRWIDGEGPIGAQGVALTAGRSLAVDPAFWPLGVPLYLVTTWPGSERPLRRLMVAQDTGSAIKGPLRGDFFWGSGAAALAQAGGMKQKGALYLLLPRAVAERRDRTS